jgi:DNA-binding LacI/PurR family transcriptional regulator
LCGVSQGTVDRALHNRLGIGSGTRARILAVAKRQGYQPHPAARELLTGERRLVGAIVPAVNGVFFMDLMNAIRAEIVPAGFSLFLTQANGRAEFLAALRDFAARRSRAVLLIPPDDATPIPPEVLSSGVDLVSLVSPCSVREAPFLGPDEVRTGREAVAYLTGMGHKRILHVTYQRQAYAIEARIRGYRAAMRARGFHPAVIRSMEAGSFQAALAQYRPTALFCHNDWMAFSVLRVLAAQGVKVPDDISVLGVDNSPTFVELCPGITTLAYPTAAIACAVRELLTSKQPPAAIPACAVVERLTVADIQQPHQR